MSVETLYQWYSMKYDGPLPTNVKDDPGPLGDLFIRKHGYSLRDWNTTVTKVLDRRIRVTVSCSASNGWTPKFILNRTYGFDVDEHTSKEHIAEMIEEIAYECLADILRSPELERKGSR